MSKSKIYYLYPEAYSSCTHWESLIRQRGIFVNIHRETTTWICLNKQKFNLLLRITLSASVWPEGKIYSLKLMHPVNPTSGWRSWFATAGNGMIAGPPAPSPHCLWASFKEVDHSGFMVAHKTLKDNKTGPFKTSALTQKKKVQCLYAVFFREPEPCNLLPLCQQTRVSNPSQPEGKSKGSTAGLAFLSPLCRTGWTVAGHTGKTSSSCQGAGLLCPTGWWQG